MQIDIAIGAPEKQQVESSFDQTSGDLIVVMDRNRALQAKRGKAYGLSVGECEKHTQALQFQLTYGDGTGDTGWKP